MMPPGPVRDAAQTAYQRRASFTAKVNDLLAVPRSSDGSPSNTSTDLAAAARMPAPTPVDTRTFNEKCAAMGDIAFPGAFAKASGEQAAEPSPTPETAAPQGFAPNRGQSSAGSESPLPESALTHARRSIAEAVSSRAIRALNDRFTPSDKR